MPDGPPQQTECCTFDITADTFMRSMNRILVGTMLEVASGLRNVEQSSRELLDGRPRTRGRGDGAAPRPLSRLGRSTRPSIPCSCMRVLLTNDDGIDAEGLQALRRALLEIPDVELAVIAPDGNRSATARSITTRRPLAVAEVDFGDGTVGYASDGMPVDCVRLAEPRRRRGLHARARRLRHQPRRQPRRRHHLLGDRRRGLRGDHPRHPGDRGQPAVRQARDGLSPRRPPSGFETAAAFTARIVGELSDVPLSPGTLLNINVPAGEPEGVERHDARQAHLPRRAQAHDDRRGRPQRLLGLRRRSRLPRRAGHRPRRGRRAGISRSRRSISTSPTTTGLDALVEHDLSRFLRRTRGSATE